MDHGKTPSLRAPQESRALRDRRTFTRHDTPVLYAPAGREVCSVPSMSVRVSQPSLYNKLLIKKNFHQGPYPTPPSGGRRRAPTYLRLMINMNQNTEEAHETAPILFQATLPGRLSPRRTVIIAQRPHGQREVDRFTG